MFFKKHKLIIPFIIILAIIVYILLAVFAMPHPKPEIVAPGPNITHSLIFYNLFDR